MTKKVLNNEEIQKKQQKQFSIGLCIGFMLFIFFILFVESDFLKNKIIVNNNLLKTPNIINVESNKKGNKLEELCEEYSYFIDEINKLKLDSLKEVEFLREKNIYKYVDENYTYIANENYLKLTRKEKDIYYIIIEEGITKIELYKDKIYSLEYSSNNIFFKVDEKSYKINANNEKYILECNYSCNEYQVNQEIYDKEWNFTNINLVINDIDYYGYFLEDIEGYSLSNDKLSIVDENGESISSTKYLDDNTTLYYTVINYEINNQTKDMLIVNNTQDFPLK